MSSNVYKSNFVLLKLVFKIAEIYNASRYYTEDSINFHFY